MREFYEFLDDMLEASAKDFTGPLEPAGHACDYCSSQEAKKFDGGYLCRSCCESSEPICRECGSMEFVTGPEGPTMCLGCRSIDTEYTPEWGDK